LQHFFGIFLTNQETWSWARIFKQCFGTATFQVTASKLMWFWDDSNRCWTENRPVVSVDNLQR